MNTALLAVGAAASTAAAWLWHRIRMARALREDRATWRANLARGLAEASLATAPTSEAAAAALKLVAEAIQGTGEMGVLESTMLAERVAEGATLDARSHLAPSIAQATVVLHEVAAARELIRVMDPAGARDASLRDDALQHLDNATQAYLGKPQSA